MPTLDAYGLQSHQHHIHFTSLHFSILSRTFSSPPHLLPHPLIHNPAHLPSITSAPTQPQNPAKHPNNMPAMFPPSPPRTPPPTYTLRPNSHFPMASPHRAPDTASSARPAETLTSPQESIFPTDLPSRPARAPRFNLQFYTLPRPTITSRPDDLEMGNISERRATPTRLTGDGRSETLRGGRRSQESEQGEIWWTNVSVIDITLITVSVVVFLCVLLALAMKDAKKLGGGDAGMQGEKAR